MSSLESIISGSFPELEDELSGFTSAGYADGSPNRADALV
jgi:phage terminase large subunit-like protein